MKKAERIKKSYEFDQFIKQTKYVKNSFFIVHYHPKQAINSRFGIAAGVKLGNAVLRNKYKRRLREIIKSERNLFSNDLDYIIIIRKPCLDLEYWQMKEKLIELINR